MNFVPFKCPECGASLTSKMDRAFMYCEYCGSKIMIDDIRYYKEDAKTYRHQQKLEAKLEAQRLKYEAKEREKQQEAENEIKEAEARAKSDKYDAIIIASVMAGLVIFAILGTILILFAT